MPKTEADMAVEDLDDDEPLRWYVIAAFMLVVVAGFALAVLLTTQWYAGCHDNRSGSSYAAGDSVRTGLCEDAHGAAGALVAVGWVAGFALATFALLRWRAGRTARVLLTGLLLTPLALPALVYGGLSLSSTSCPADKDRAYRQWVDEGAKGQAPYDCRTF